MKLKQLIAALILLAMMSPIKGHASGAGAAQDVVTLGIMTYTVNQMFGKKYEKKCSSVSVWACSLAIAFGVQSILTMDSTKSAAKTGCQMNPELCSGGGFPTYDPLTKNPIPDVEKHLNNAGMQVRKNLEDLKKKGYEADKEKGVVKTPKGDVPFAALASGESMLEAGLLDADGAALYDQALKERDDKLRVVSMGLSGGGAGGARSPSSAKYVYEDPYSSFNFGQKETPNAPKTSGLSRALGSNQVGIASDNIFEMVHRRYQEKNDQGEFVAP